MAQKYPIGFADITFKIDKNNSIHFYKDGNFYGLDNHLCIGVDSLDRYSPCKFLTLERDLKDGYYYYTSSSKWLQGYKENGNIIEAYLTTDYDNYRFSFVYTGELELFLVEKINHSETFYIK
jgi:hypothetical protein